MRLIFMGTPEFAAASLASLIAAGHEIAAVYSQPPRPAGRGHKDQRSPVHELAVSHGLTVRTPAKLKGEAEQREFAALGADVAVVAAYGLILPKPILTAPKHGCLNIHASLLPRWRGAAPIQRAILAGDKESGITIMQMNEGLDTGPMLLQGRVAIGPQTTASSLHDDLAALGAKLIVEALDKLKAGALPATPQPADGVTYAAKLTREEGKLDWARSAVELERQVRAFTPWPGAWFDVRGERFKVSAAAVAQGSGAPGVVLDDKLTVACGTGALRLETLQRAGKAAMTAGDLLRGYPIPAGTVLA